jgi:putative DNA primase/helicase
MTRRTRSPARQERPITLDLVRDALSFIPPDVTHDDRVRLAFAVWDGVGDAGADAWLSWAGQRAGADAAEDRSTWKSARKPGRIKVGTLFGMAKDHGFRFPEAGEEAPAPDPAALAAAAAERERKRQAEEAQYRERADRAARVARDMWADAAATGASAYLQRKGVQPHGLRFLPDGTVLVPMRDAAGELQNLQRIAPVKPADGQPEKRFLPGGRKSGLWHLIGELGSAAAAPGGDDAGVCTTGDAAPAELQPDAPAVLVLAEGYATGASVREATGWPVAVCFDAGNLKPCALALHGLYPGALLLVCGDDDRATEARTGTNPGRVKGAAAVRAVLAAGGRAGLVLPAGLPEGGTDFNDLHAHAGADALRAQVLAAALALQAGTQSAAGADPTGADAGEPADPDSGLEPASSNTPADASAGPLGDDPPPAEADVPAGPAKRPRGRNSSRGRGDDAPDRDGGADLPGGFDRFRVDDSGVWFTPPAGDDGTTGSARRVCDRLEVLALARDMHDKGGALLLDFDSQFRPRPALADAAVHAGRRRCRLPGRAAGHGLHRPHRWQSAPLVDRVPAKPAPGRPRAPGGPRGLAGPGLRAAAGDVVGRQHRPRHRGRRRAG